MRNLFLLVLAVGATGCGDSEPDGRLVGTLYTNTCDWSGSEWLGVERIQVSLEYIPGALPDRSLPSGACSLDAHLFAEENRVSDGDDIPDLEGTPRWTSTTEAGTLDAAQAGLWIDDHAPSGGCGTVAELAGGGLSLVDAGVFDGVTTPAPSTDPGLVYLDGLRDDEWQKPLQRGNPIDISWTGTGWDESFVQIRQLNGDTVRQTLTCNTTGMSAFALTTAVWDQLEDVGADRVALYVGFQNRGEVKVKGDTLETLTRVVHGVYPDE